MKYRDLNIQTQREFPNNMRAQGFGWLVRAGYMTREGEILPLGEQAAKQIHPLLSTLTNGKDVYFPISIGSVEVVRCSSCGYAEKQESAQFKKIPFSTEAPLPVEKILTPDCHTIESLAAFLNIPKEKTAKALMYTRVSDSRFVFVVVRGDMTLSEAKLKLAVGAVRMATEAEITDAGAVPGYAAPIGLNAKRAFIIVDNLIPQSPNLAAGANEAGYHLINTNYGRDYSAEIVTDLVQANAGDACINCGNVLEVVSALPLMVDSKVHFENLLLALTETFHDDKGLMLPKSAAPFDVYLMHVPGKELDTRAKAEEIYKTLQDADIKVLFDDRDERAGVKFNDADLIGCPVRVTVGERGLKDGKVEVKPRTAASAELVDLRSLPDYLRKL
jgi:prolyl-tRNA synthetase